MCFDQVDRADQRLQHMKRWVNMFFYRRMAFAEYEPWKKVLNSPQTGLFDHDPVAA